jgi:hypothetical protein
VIDPNDKEGRHVGQPQHKKVPNHTKENDLGTEKKGEVRCIREAMGQACVGADPCVCSKMKRRYGVYEKKEGRHVGQPPTQEGAKSYERE